MSSKELNILKNSKQYILRDLNSYVFQKFYNPSKERAAKEIQDILSLDITDQKPSYHKVSDFSISGLSVVPAAVQIILETEDFSPIIYIDNDGSPTIAFGQHISKVSGGWKTDFGYFIADNQIPMVREVGLEIFKQKISLVANDIRSAIQKNTRTDKQINPNQFSALCSLGYNMGVPGLLRTKLMQYIYIGEFSRAAYEFLDITNGGMAGLVKRRKLEVELFNS